MPFTTIVPPASDPVSLSQAKQHLRIDQNDEDDLISDLIAAATSQVEIYLSHMLSNRTLRQYVDEFPRSLCQSLAAWPVSQVVGVNGYDSQGNLVVINPLHYKLEEFKDPARLVFEPDVAALDLCNGVEIDFIAGYGDSDSDVPSNITHAILVLISHWYEFRGAVAASTQSVSTPPGWENLLAAVRRVRI